MVVLDEQAKHFISPDRRFKLVLSVYLILVDDGKTLLLRRVNTGYEDGKYGLASGHADGGETARSATCREALEEIGIKIKPDDLKLVHTMHRRQNDERIDLFFTTDRWEGEPQNMEPKKCDDLNWFDLNDLPFNTIPYIRKVLEAYSHNVAYSEFWEPDNA